MLMYLYTLMENSVQNLDENQIEITEKKEEKINDNSLQVVELDVKEEIKEEIKESILISLIKSEEKINEILKKFNIEIEKDLLKKILNIMEFSSSQSNDFFPVIDEVKKILLDGKIEVFEIPELINIINSNLKKSDLTELDENDYVLFIKVLLVVLIESGIIKINSEDLEIICKLIDASVKLLLTKTNLIQIKKGCLSCFLT